MHSDMDFNSWAWPSSLDDQQSKSQTIYLSIYLPIYLSVYYTYLCLHLFFWRHCHCNEVFAEMVIVDFFRFLDERQQASWKHLLQASPDDGFYSEHSKVETQLKLLYTTVTRSQRRLNFVETLKKKADSSSSPRSWSLQQGWCLLMNGYIVGWNLHGRRGSIDLKTETVEGQEKSNKTLRTRLNGWTWRYNASARQVHPVISMWARHN